MADAKERRSQAIRFYNQAVSAANDKSDPKNLQVAYQLFASACAIDPTFPEAFYMAGNANSDMAQSGRATIPAAIAAWRRGLECEMSDDLRGMMEANLAWRIHSLGHYDEALKLALKAVERAPDKALGHLNLSVIYQGFNQLPQAIVHARKAFELDPATAINETNLAFALLYDGQYEEGFRHFEARFNSHFTEYLKLPYERWTGEADKTVFVASDQGLGDTLSFARFVPAAAKRAKFLYLAIHHELVRAFTHAFMHIPNITVLPKNTSNFPMADCWTTFVSLPFALGLTNDEIKSAPDPAWPQLALPDTWKVPGRKIHIGVAWWGSPLNMINEFRSIPLAQFMELYRVPGVQLYSLQVGERQQEMHAGGYAPVVVDLTGYIRDVVDTWSLLKHLDLVICCESALGHICGAIGKEAWIPYSYQGKDWRAGLRGEKKLWYPKHRFFLQGKDRSWGPVFEDINKNLERRMAKHAMG